MGIITTIKKGILKLRWLPGGGFLSRNIEGAALGALVGGLIGGYILYLAVTKQSDMGLLSSLPDSIKTLIGMFLFGLGLVFGGLHGGGVCSELSLSGTSCGVLIILVASLFTMIIGAIIGAFIDSIYKPKR